MDIVKVEKGTDISVGLIDLVYSSEEISYDGLIVMGEKALAIGTLSKILLGKLYSRCSRKKEESGVTEKEMFAAELGLSKRALRKYAQVAGIFGKDFIKSIEEDSVVSYSHFAEASSLSTSDAGKRKLIKYAVANGLTSTEVRGYVSEFNEKEQEEAEEVDVQPVCEEVMEGTSEASDGVVKKIDSTPFENPETEDERNANYLYKLREKKRRARIIPYIAWSIFGVSIRQVNQKSWGILKRSYAKYYHPDAEEGSDKRWSVFNEAVAYVESNLVAEFKSEEEWTV